MSHRRIELPGAALELRELDQRLGRPRVARPRIAAVLDRLEAARRRDRLLDRRRVGVAQRVDQLREVGPPLEQAHRSLVEQPRRYLPARVRLARLALQPGPRRHVSRDQFIDRARRVRSVRTIRRAQRRRQPRPRRLVPQPRHRLSGPLAARRPFAEREPQQGRQPSAEPDRQPRRSPGQPALEQRQQRRHVGPRRRLRREPTDHPAQQPPRQSPIRQPDRPEFDRLDALRERPPAERRVPVQRLVERHAEREHIRPRIDRQPHELLRGHVRRRPEDRPGARQTIARVDRLRPRRRLRRRVRPGQPEVGDPRPPTAVGQHVLRFKILEGAESGACVTSYGYVPALPRACHSRCPRRRRRGGSRLRA